MLAAFPAHAEPVGLFTSLPILWREESELSGLLRPAERHWARSVLDAEGKVVPLDRLSQVDPRFVHLHFLLMAQPRPLAAEENVALDRWLSRGGRLLLFADPMLTEDSAFPLGDRRRPQDVVRLDALFKRWGVQLRFDARQPAGERIVTALGARVPVNLPGELVSIRRGGACRISAGGLVAKCRIGRGRVVIVADAALFERGPGNGDDLRRAALKQLILAAGAGSGASLGKSGKNRVRVR